MPFLREKSGKWSAEKIVAFTGACIPVLWLAWRAWSGDLNPARPINEAIHSLGNYAIWLVILSLAVTPARRLFNAPPFGEVIKLTVALEDRAAAENKAHDMATELRSRARDTSAPVEVLGPLPAYIARRAGRWRFHVILRGKRPIDVLGQDPGAPWSVDVDPESLL